jgi:hypothetical protein
MKLSEVQQLAIQARMAQIVGAENYDRMFVGVVFSEVADSILCCVRAVRMPLYISALDEVPINRRSGAKDFDIP